MSRDLTREIVTAADNGELKTVESLLKEGASPDAMGPNSGALHCAAFKGHKEVVALLLQHGAKTDLADHQHFYPLQLAASKGHKDICELLIKAGAPLEAKTEHGGTALHVAAASDFPAVVTLLVKAGADQEATDNGGNTPLSTACGLGRLKVAKGLIKSGANVHALNDSLETTLIKAVRAIKPLRVKNWYSEGENGGIPVRYEVKEGLFTYTKAGSTKVLSLKDQRYCASQWWGPQAHLVYLDACELVGQLLKAGVDVNAVDSDGQTALGLACHSGESKVIEVLFKAGAKVDTVNGAGVTPLHFAAGSGRLDGLEMFLKLVPNVNVHAVDEYGWTPLHYLADIGGDVKMAQLLLEKGASRTAKSTKTRGGDLADGSTPSDVAAHWRDQVMAEALKPN